MTHAPAGVAERLRKWSAVVPVPPAVKAMNHAAREIERLRSENDSLRDWVLELQMDTKEREAIQRIIGIAGPGPDTAAIRGLLERHRAV